MYLHLARASEEQRKPLQRDKFLVLAGGAALEANFPRVAEECRQRLLADNPNHILRNFATMREAFESEDIVHYANQLLRTYPFEKAEYLLEKYRASGYSSGHGYGSLGSRSDAMPGDAARRSGAQHSTGKAGYSTSDSVNDLADFDLAEIESLGALDSYGLDDWPDPYGRAHGAGLRKVSLRTVYWWTAFGLLAGAAIGVALAVAIQGRL